MKKIIGILIIVLAFAIAYFGFEKLNDSKKGVKIGDVAISSTDKNSQRGAYLLIGSSVVLLIAGILVMYKSPAK